VITSVVLDLVFTTKPRDWPEERLLKLPILCLWDVKSIISRMPEVKRVDQISPVFG